MKVHICKFLPLGATYTTLCWFYAFSMRNYVLYCFCIVLSRQIPSFHDFIILIVGLFTHFIRMCNQELSNFVFYFYQSNTVISNDVSEPCKHFYLYQTSIFVVFSFSYFRSYFFIVLFLLLAWVWLSKFAWTLSTTFAFCSTFILALLTTD